MKEHYYPIIYLIVFSIIVLVPLFLAIIIEPLESSYIIVEVVDIQEDKDGGKILVVQNNQDERFYVE